VEVGVTSRSDVAPGVTKTPGVITARRPDDAGQLRFLQTTALLNPGNSGGPMVDADGYAIGIVSMKLADANGIGFAIPINLAKRFLERYGIDQLLPARMLALGPPHVLDAKGLRLRLPYGFQDVAHERLRVEAGQQATIALRIDRVDARSDLDQMRRVLLSGRPFEQATWSPMPSRDLAGRDRPALAGEARSTAASDGDLRMVYQVTDLGREKIVARYVGAAEEIAANMSILRESLASLEADPLLVSEVIQPPGLVWAAADVATLPGTRLPVPAGWVLEYGAPSSCAGLPPPHSGIVVSPAGDFTVSFRLGWWDRAALDLDRASRACAPRRDTAGSPAYASRLVWFGSAYTIEGVFAAVGGDYVAQAEVVAPEQKHGLVRALFAEWVKLLSGGAPPPGPPGTGPN
jgi:hypothetical protein